MSGWFFIEFSTFLLLCALVIPLVWMKIQVVRQKESAHRVTMKALLIAAVLGIPGVILEMIAGVTKTQPRPGWFFISLGMFFLFCTFVVPAFWRSLITRLYDGPEELGVVVVGCIYPLLIALPLGFLSSVLLLIGMYTLDGPGAELQSIVGWATSLLTVLAVVSVGIFLLIIGYLSQFDNSVR